MKGWRQWYLGINLFLTSCSTSVRGDIRHLTSKKMTTYRTYSQSYSMSFHFYTVRFETEIIFIDFMHSITTRSFCIIPSAIVKVDSSIWPLSVMVWMSCCILYFEGFVFVQLWQWICFYCHCHCRSTVVCKYRVPLDGDICKTRHHSPLFAKCTKQRPNQNWNNNALCIGTTNICINQTSILIKIDSPRIPMLDLSLVIVSINIS